MNNFFMSIAEEEALLSDDPTTKVGAIIVKDNTVISTGHNCAVNGFPINEIPYNGRDPSLPVEKQKYSYICHAEINAIINAKNELNNCEMYVTITPCFDCAKAIIQAGIKTVYYKQEYHRKDVWNMAKILFNKCNVKYIKVGD